MSFNGMNGTEINDTEPVGWWIEIALMKMKITPTVTTTLNVAV